jgi:GNAT superfamily N-acetyltransferase
MIRLDRLGPGEGPRLREVRLQALQESPDAFGETLEASLKRTPEEWARQVDDLPTFVAVADGRDVGMVRCAQDRSDASTAWLISMWVAPAMRGRGIGTRLVREVVALARGQGCRRILLEVADQNRPAVALYASRGFAPNGAVGSLPPPRDHILEHQRELKLEEEPVSIPI